MSLKESITEDMKNAMRAKDSERLGTIRLLLAAIKQRKDSFSQFQAAGREDLASKEAGEILVLQEYMPQQLSEGEVSAAVQAALAETGAAGPQDMGRVMAVLKARLAGRTDMTKLSGLVKAALAGSK
jgi:uncharacterized protein YqeY